MHGASKTKIRGDAVEVVVLDMVRPPMKNYSYLVADPAGRRAIIIDPAWQMEKIDAALERTGAGLSGILITHGHPDHIHLAAPLAERHQCPIWMPRPEIEACGFRSAHLVGIDAAPWSVGRIHIEPIFTPGHTPGSTCYKIGDNAFTGDTLFAEGCGICPDTQAACTLFESLERLKTSLDPHTRIFPGHSYGKPPGQPFSLLLKENIYLQFTNKEDFAGYRMRKGQNMSRIFEFI